MTHTHLHPATAGGGYLATTTGPQGEQQLRITIVPGDPEDNFRDEEHVIRICRTDGGHLEMRAAQALTRLRPQIASTRMGDDGAIYCTLRPGHVRVDNLPSEPLALAIAAAIYLAT